MSRLDGLFVRPPFAVQRLSLALAAGATVVVPVSAQNEERIDDASAPQPEPRPTTLRTVKIKSTAYGPNEMPAELPGLKADFQRSATKMTLVDP